MRQLPTVWMLVSHSESCCSMSRCLSCGNVPLCTFKCKLWQYVSHSLHGSVWSCKVHKKCTMVIKLQGYKINMFWEKISSFCQECYLGEFPLWEGIFNSLSLGRYGCHFKMSFSILPVFSIFRSFYDNALRWMPQDLTGDKSISCQVMAWCHPALWHH